jgi:hypothetical protein
MFDSPKQQEFSAHFQPGTYLAVLLRLEPAPDGGFGRGVYWWWNLFNTGKNKQGYDDPKIIVPIFTGEPDGSLYEYRFRTTTKFGKDRVGDKTANARKFSEALLGREIDDEEDQNAIAKELPGKKCVLHIIEHKKPDGRVFLDIEFAEPYRKGMLAPPRPMPTEDNEPPAEEAEGDDPFAAAFAGAPAATGATVKGDADEDSLPF